MRQTWESIVDLWDTGNFFGRLAIVLLLGWPVVLALAVVFGGIRGDVAIFLALIPAGALALLLLVIPPMLPVLVMAFPAQPFVDVRFLRWIQFPSRAERLRALKRALKFLTLVAGIETAIGIYVAGVPVWQDPGLTLWLLAITAVFVLMWFGGVRHKWLTRAFVIAFLVITVTFFAGGRNDATRKVSQAVQAFSPAQIPGVQAQAQPGKEIIRITLLGEDRQSERFLGPGMVPAGWRYEFEYSGPGVPQVHFDDGTVSSITMEYGIKGGVRRFTGPAGQEVVVRAYPPK